MHKKRLTTAVLLGLSGFTATAAASGGGVVGSGSLAAGGLGLQIQGNLNPPCLYGGIYPSCAYGAFDTAAAGSYFTLNGSPGAAIDGKEIMMVDGRPQNFEGTIPYLGGGSHVTKAWDFFGGKGVNVHSGLFVANNDTEIDMSSWAMVWNEIPFITLGGDSANFPVDTGIAALTCTGGINPLACEAGETFTIDYSAHIPAGDPSGFGGVVIQQPPSTGDPVQLASSSNDSYFVHLQGTVVHTVPVPAAVWLFGSGLFGLIGFARRGKNV